MPGTSGHPASERTQGSLVRTARSWARWIVARAMPALRHIGAEEVDGFLPGIGGGLGVVVSASVIAEGVASVGVGDELHALAHILELLCERASLFDRHA